MARSALALAEIGRTRANEVVELVCDRCGSVTFRAAAALDGDGDRRCVRPDCTGTRVSANTIATGLSPFRAAGPSAPQEAPALSVVGEELVRRTLAVARDELGLDVAYLTEFVGDAQIVRATSGSAQAFGLETGASVALDGSYCQRVVDGRLEHVVPDTSRNPVVAELPVTRDANLGAYVGIPVRFADGTLYGTLCAASTAAVPRLAEQDVAFMSVLARLLADSVARERDHDRDLRALEREGAAKSKFISSFSHEVRTPLNAILVRADLIERDGLTPAQRAHSDGIRQAGAHLLALLEDTLDLGRAEAGALPVRLEVVDVAEAVAEAVSLIEPEIAGGGGVVTIGDEAAGLFAVADRQRLRQSLLNLMSNAAKYGRGKVAVRYRADGEQASIAVEDDGAGIPDAELGRLFTRFDRLAAGDGGPQGFGVGLALTRELVELMGGSIGVTSTAGAGTVFTIRLKRARPPGRDGSGPRRRREIRVLCVEDDLGALSLVEAVLAGRAQVRGARRGADALRIAAEDDIDVVLLDMHLVDMHGLDVLAALRADPRTRQIPVVIVTGETSQEVHARARTLGAGHLLVKPWAPEQLEAVVDAAILRAGSR